MLCNETYCQFFNTNYNYNCIKNILVIQGQWGTKPLLFFHDWCSGDLFVAFLKFSLNIFFYSKQGILPYCKALYKSKLISIKKCLQSTDPKKSKGLIPLYTLFQITMKVLNFFPYNQIDTFTPKPEPLEKESKQFLTVILRLIKYIIEEQICM